MTAPAWPCPACRTPIPGGGPTVWACPGCGARYRGLRGIPDLRVAEDGYLSNGKDWDRALRIDAAFDRLDFAGLLDRLLELDPALDAASRRSQVAHIRSAPGRVGAWLDALGGPDGLPPGPILDLGCGSGSFLAAAAGRVHPRPLIGVDVALRWLLVARKRLDEAGLGSIPLVCGNAEGLPLANGSVAAVVAGDVIEHVADQARTVSEAHRVLAPGGRLFLASPNRFSLAPEPHVGVWGVGYLPRAWMTGYVRRISGRDFRAIRTLGWGEWSDLLRRGPFMGGRIAAPGLPATDLERFGPAKRGLARAYNAALRLPMGQAVARRVGPLFHVVCTRGGAEPPPGPTSRAIRPGSRRPAAPATTAKP